MLTQTRRWPSICRKSAVFCVVSWCLDCVMHYHQIWCQVNFICSPLSLTYYFQFLLHYFSKNSLFLRLWTSSFEQAIHAKNISLNSHWFCFVYNLGIEAYFIAVICIYFQFLRNVTFLMTFETSIIKINRFPWRF